MPSDNANTSTTQTSVPSHVLVASSGAYGMYGSCSLLGEHMCAGKHVSHVLRLVDTAYVHECVVRHVGKQVCRDIVLAISTLFAPPFVLENVLLIVLTSMQAAQASARVHVCGCYDVCVRACGTQCQSLSRQACTCSDGRVGRCKKSVHVLIHRHTDICTTFLEILLYTCA